MSFVLRIRLSLLTKSPKIEKKAGKKNFDQFKKFLPVQPSLEEQPSYKSYKCLFHARTKPATRKPVAKGSITVPSVPISLGDEVSFVLNDSVSVLVI